MEPSIIRQINMEFLKSKSPKTICCHKADAETIADTDKPLSFCAERPSGVGDGSPPPFLFNVSEPTSFDSLEKFVSTSSCSDSRPERLQNDTVDTVRSGIERHSVARDATSSFVQTDVAEPIECHADEWFCDVCEFYMRLQAVNDHLKTKRHRTLAADRRTGQLQ